MTPRVMGEAANTDYLREVTYEDACRVRREMLSTTREDLRALSDVLAASYEGRAVCVVGGKDKVDACEDRLDTVRDM
jgi:Zn-dependent M16 (insulinase) family peptidase